MDAFKDRENLNMKPKIKVVQKSPEHPVLEIVAQDIKAISNLGRQINTSRLNQKAVIILLAHMTQLPQNTIRMVLDALPQLERQYLK